MVSNDLYYEGSNVRTLFRREHETTNLKVRVFDFIKTEMPATTQA